MKKLIMVMFILACIFLTSCGEEDEFARHRKNGPWLLLCGKDVWKAEGRALVQNCLACPIELYVWNVTDQNGRFWEFLKINLKDCKPYAQIKVLQED